MEARSAAPRRRAARAHPLSGLAGAITFLTVAPLPAVGAELTAAAPWFPLVGAMIGLVAGGVRAAGQRLLHGHAPGSALAVGALVLLTGALHQDGLADTADALGARGGREKRLEIMRDSSIGVFGALALILWAMLLFSVVDVLSLSDALRALVVAGALSRWAALLHAARTSPARSDGLGAALQVGPGALGVASVTALVIALAVGDPGAGAAALAATLLVAGGMSLYARRSLGGRTGDTLGATVAIAEVAVCAVLCGIWH
ncbi:MAG TPA: adenosylcobinamide-GDP ribazoletransferase [Solirubrobacteraceae bacterium]|jgi:adenosylcobinamide-GDP ribazoletransferase|nr:adenosylcobinamide-GDP ribazoletransferase [Solirubrobacteraceae bacterium]